MKPRIISILLFAVCMVVTACGGSPALPFSGVSGPGVTTLWEDVPPFPASAPDVETNAFFNSRESAMVSIQYYTDSPPADVAAYYTYEMMHAQGWETPDVKEMKFFSRGPQGGPEDQIGTLTGCWSDVYKGEPRAGCWFNKIDSTGHDIELTITAERDRNDASRFMLTYTRTTGSLVITPTP